VKVLVTGANGFVGQRLVRRLSDDGQDVLAGCGPDAAGAGGSRESPRVRWTPLDVTNEASVAAFIGDGADALVHLAGLASAREANREPAKAWLVNAVGTALVAQTLAERERRRGREALFLLSSSAEVYLPQTRHSHVETDPTGPATPYAASKLAAELAAAVAARAGGLRVIAARPFPHFGAGQSPAFWVMRRVQAVLGAKRAGAPAVAVGDLSAVRDFLHVDDVVDAYIRLLAPGVPAGAYNIASGTAVTLEELHRKLEAQVGIRLVHERHAREERSDARAYHVGSAAKLHAATGWAPRRSLDEALSEVIKEMSDAEAN